MRIRGNIRVVETLFLTFSVPKASLIVKEVVMAKSFNRISGFER